MINRLFRRTGIAALSMLLVSCTSSGFPVDDERCEFYGDTILSHNVRIHTFLVNAWIAYCKGNTSILALQNVLYKTFTQTDVPLFDKEMQSIATGPFPVST